MTVIQQREPQDTLAEDERVKAELSDGTRLIRTDEGSGIVRPPVDAHLYEREYGRWTDARLFFGYLIEIGGWPDHAPESPMQAVPLEVAAAGKDALAAYLLVGTGTTNPRSFVAQKLGVTEQTVSNYAGRVRWSDE